MPRLENTERYERADTKTILATAREVCRSEIEQSLVFDSDAISRVPRFEASEVVLGRVVGRGGFCAVFEISAIRLKGSRKGKGGKSTDSGHDSASDTEGKNSSRSGKSNGFSRAGRDTPVIHDDSSREYLARRVWSNSGKYVVKQLDHVLLERDKVNYLKGLVDLSLELHFLASCNHMNILDVRGVSSADPFGEVGYFLVLDLLDETLSKRLNSWMHADRRTKGITGFLTGGRKKETTLLVKRLIVAHDIAEGMNYLHSRNIIYRDLKPDNIGFDSEGTVKIFDFGLAKELRDSEYYAEGLYRLTGFTGAIRYMAPEVGLRKPYNLAADVYSWSMLMWYILALEPPLGLYTPNMFIDRVFRKGYRPATQVTWPEKISDLLKECWSANIKDRPNFQQIMATIRRETQAVDPEMSGILGGESTSSRSGDRTAEESKRY